MDRDMLSKATAEMTNDFMGSLNRMKEYAAQVESLESETGIVFLKNEYILRYCSSFDVTRDQLPAIRKAVGRLEIYGKNLANNFETTGEIVVTVKPKSAKFNRLRFEYRTKFRAGGKCKVVEQESKYKSLVCSV